MNPFFKFLINVLVKFGVIPPSVAPLLPILYKEEPLIEELINEIVASYNSALKHPDCIKVISEPNISSEAILKSLVTQFESSVNHWGMPGVVCYILLRKQMNGQPVKPTPKPSPRGRVFVEYPIVPPPVPGYNSEGEVVETEKK